MQQKSLNQYTAIDAFEPSFDADGNATLIRTSTGTWSVSYDGANRPIRFENAETQTVVECGYDSLGRRFEKKVSVAGTTTLHERYLYKDYLQVAAFNVDTSGETETYALKRVIYWDPTEPTATHPLAVNIINDGIYFPAVDLTKNVCELVDVSGEIAATYDYAPFGAVSAGTPSGSSVPANPLQWSSEVYDSELDLVYYNYRHYSPTDGRWLSRDPIEEQGGRNLYAFVKNNALTRFDFLGASFSDWFYCLGKCIEDNDIIDNFYAALASKVALMLAGGGVPKRFAVWIAQQAGEHKMAMAIANMDPKQPSSMLAWKPMKTFLSKFKNGRILAKNIAKVSTPLMIIYGNIMAAIEAECAIHCCCNKRYNKQSGLSIFNVPATMDFYFSSLTWEDLGYEEEDLLP